MPKKHLKNHTRFLLPLSLFIGSLCLYLHNLSPSVYGGDVGDLVAAAYTGGVPHAPGYPLFTLLGFILSHVLFFFTPAFAVGLISAFSGALGVLFFFLTLRRLKIHPLVAFIATATLATNYLFWFYNEIAEVFALNTLFIILLFFLGVSFSQTKSRRYFFFSLFVLGLSFIHHQIIILFVLSYLLLVIPTLFSQRKYWKKYLLGIAFFFLGILPIIYIPIAASLHPPINWDSVHDIQSFLHLFLRKDYGTFQAGAYSIIDTLERLIILKSYAQTLLFQLTIPVCVLGVIGAIYAIFKQRLVAFALLLAGVLSGPVFVTYAAFPLNQNFFFGVNERFFTMSAILAVYFFAFGVEAIRSFVVEFLKRPIYSLLIPLLFLLIPLQLFFYNFPKTNLSQVWIGDNLGKDVLSPLPPHAVLFLTGDTVLFNTQYMHYARHVRPDIDLVNFATIDYDPYIKYIENKILAKNPLLKNNTPLLTIAVFEEVKKTRPVFSSVKVQGGKQKLIWIPYGMYYQLIPSQYDIPTESDFTQQAQGIWQQFHIHWISSKVLGSLTISEIPTMYSSSLVATGAYIDTQYHANDEAKKYYEKAISLDPSNAKAYAILGLYYLTDVKDCNLANGDLIQAITLDPSAQLPYLLLYSSYRTCSVEADRASAVAKKYKQIFKEDILQGIRRMVDGKEGDF